MRQLSKQLPKQKASTLQSDGVKLLYAPCMDDSDPPDFLSDNEIRDAMKALAKDMGWTQ